MVFSPFGLDNKVIHIALDLLMQEVVKDMRHNLFHSGSCILETEGLVAVNALWSAEGCM